MSKLVLKSDHSVEIVGIVERLFTIASITDVVCHPDGELTWAYTGENDVLWDTQEPIEPLTFKTERGDEVSADGVELIEC